MGGIVGALQYTVPEKQTMGTERILVVDDEDPIREIVCAMLASAGYACCEANSGVQALALLESGQPFDLMLTDLIMAELDGIGLLECTKERFPDMPVVMVTAVHDISVALAAIRNGAYDYLLKPFEREQLLAMARRALENRRLKLENRAYQTGLESQVAARTEQLHQAMKDLEHAMKDLERSYDITLEALGKALDLKDAETEGHSKRVTAFTVAIARAMGMADDKIRVVARGAFLHDVGKMAIPDAILRKPEKLTPAETAKMQEHCVRGYQILRKIPFLQEAAEIVYAHQERWDGTGYPRGLKGEDIPIGARIFAVADTLDAIRSDRPYRRKQSFAAAREEIARWSGKQFDPGVVNTFLAMPERLWEDLRQDIDAQVDEFSQMYNLTRNAHYGE
jgi:putative nucleotidyltransferase with HDIG domain